MMPYLLLTRYLIGNSLILGNLGKVLKSDKSILDFMIVENGAFFGTGQEGNFITDP